MLMPEMIQSCEPATALTFAWELTKLLAPIVTGSLVALVANHLGEKRARQEALRQHRQHKSGEAEREHRRRESERRTGLIALIEELNRLAIEVASSVLADEREVTKSVLIAASRAEVLTGNEALQTFITEVWISLADLKARGASDDEIGHKMDLVAVGEKLLRGHVNEIDRDLGFQPTYRGATLDPYSWQLPEEYRGA
jgi:hypothetical protein